MWKDLEAFKSQPSILYSSDVIQHRVGLTSRLPEIHLAKHSEENKGDSSQAMKNGRSYLKSRESIDLLRKCASQTILDATYLLYSKDGQIEKVRYQNQPHILVPQPFSVSVISSCWLSELYVRVHAEARV